MRDPVPNAALPRAPDRQGHGEGLRVAGDGVRCPHCGKKIAEDLRGTITFICPRNTCHRRVTLTR